jgi:DNA repair photolyase
MTSNLAQSYEPKGNPLIYRPGGAALEYAPLAANLYLGCSHACVYCYAARMALRFRQVESLREFHGQPRPKRERVSEMLACFEYDAFKLAQAQNTNPVLLSFSCDPYQTLEREEGITREALLTLSLHGQQAAILTKAPHRALLDFDLIKRGGHSLGVTITTLEHKLARELEPKAPGPWLRLAALNQAAEGGIKTWLSLEPIITPDLALAVLDAATKNHKHHLALGLKSGSAYEEKHDWPGFAAKAKALLEARGYTEVTAEQGWEKQAGTYLIKQSLRKVCS